MDVKVVYPGWPGSIYAYMVIPSVTKWKDCPSLRVSMHAYSSYLVVVESSFSIVVTVVSLISVLAMPLNEYKRIKSYCFVSPFECPIC